MSYPEDILVTQDGDKVRLDHCAWQESVVLVCTHPRMAKHLRATLLGLCENTITVSQAESRDKAQL